MEFEEDKKIDIDKPIDLEVAANTIIALGLRELQRTQPETKLCLPKKKKRKPKSKRMIPGNMHQFMTRILRRLAARTKQVNELKEKIRSMELNSLVNIEKPTFSNPQNIHPLNFIENLTAYIENNPSIHSAVDTAIDCLYEDAKNWATILKPSWKNFDDFKKDFLRKYWGDVEQSLLRNEIANGCWDRKTETMCGHFTYLIAQAKWLTHEIPETQLVYEMMRHYPSSVQVAWCGIKNRTVLEAIEFLQKLDDIDKQFEIKKQFKNNKEFEIKKHVEIRKQLEIIKNNNAITKGEKKRIRKELLMQRQQCTQIKTINKFTQTNL